MTKNRVDEVQLVKQGLVRSFMAEESRYTITYSRYGKHEPSTRVSSLKPMRAFGHAGR